MTGAARPEPGTVRVWVVATDVPAPDEARLGEVLDDEERDRAAAFAEPPARRRFVVAHGVLRLVAADALGVAPNVLRWNRGRYGKPALADPWSGLHTSLSHSADLALVALCTDRPVGVDVQHVVPGADTLGMAVRYFAAAEAAAVAAGRDARERADRFAALWARKEAVIKAAGGRMWSNLRIPVYGRELARCAEPAGVYRLREVAVPAGYRAAVALAGTAPYAVQVHTWSSDRSPPAPAPIG